ncbi:MAG: hypothetical protein QM758_04515 [Armatimonas sp.]
MITGMIMPMSLHREVGFNNVFGFFDDKNAIIYWRKDDMEENDQCYVLYNVKNKSGNISISKKLQTLYNTIDNQSSEEIYTSKIKSIFDNPT